MACKAARGWRVGAVLAATVLLVATGGQPVASHPVAPSLEASTTTYRASVSSEGSQSSGYTETAELSADCRYVAFASSATGLVDADTNGGADVFVHDLDTGATEVVSQSGHGERANLESWGPSMSATGRYVAFYSFASNLVPGDTNGVPDAFVHDRVSGATQRVSVNSHGVQQNGFGTGAVAISADGRYVAFESQASNLVPGDTNHAPDVFRHNILTGATRRVSVAASGLQANGTSTSPVISGDGRYVAFTSYASNLVDGDGNGLTDVYRRDTKTGTTRRISVNSRGQGARGRSVVVDISANGRYLLFSSEAGLVPADTNGRWNAYVRDQVGGWTRRVLASSIPQEYESFGSSIAPGGHFVAITTSTAFTDGEQTQFSDVFVHNLDTNQVRRASVSWDGQVGNEDSYQASLCSDWRRVAFVSQASNLVPGDTNSTADVFVRIGP